MEEYVVVKAGNPYVNYQFLNGMWTSEFPFFEGTLEACKQWILTQNSKYGYKDEKYDVWPSAKWHKGKAKLDADRRSWEGCNDFYGW